MKKIYTYSADEIDESLPDRQTGGIRYLSKRSFRRAQEQGMECRIVGKTSLKEVKDEDGGKYRLLLFRDRKYKIEDSLFSRTVGYIPLSGGMFLEYRRTVIPLIVFFLLAVIAGLYFLLSGALKPTPVLHPDFQLAQEDWNQLPVAEDGAFHTLTITLPDGDISLRDSILTFENEALKAQDREYEEDLYSGMLRITAYMRKDGEAYLIFDDDVLVTEGKLPEIFLDFFLQKTELLSGVHDGTITLAYGGDKLVETNLKVVIRQRTGGTMEIDYDTKVNIYSASGSIAMHYAAVSTATHDTVLQLLLDKDGQEYLLAQSGVIKPGYGIERMKLLDTAPAMSKGQYTGRLRLNFYAVGSNEALAGLKTDIEVKIYVH